MNTFEEFIKAGVVCTPCRWGLRRVYKDGRKSDVAFGKTIPMLPCQLVEFVGPIDGFEWVKRDD
jgi:hypothetical protein